MNLEIIIDCINSIIKFNDVGDRLEIIIVDNSPNDKVFNYIKDKYPIVKIIKNENNGFGGGNNVGVINAKGEYLLFLNPDTILVEPIFEFAINKFKEDEKLALFGLKLIDVNFKRNMSFYFLDRYGIISGQIIKLCNKLDVFIGEKMFISGANMFIRKDIFIESGMFDENIFMYSEEKDLTKRVKSLNKKIAYFKEKKIIHLEGKTTLNNINALQIRLESLKYYCSKYGLNYNKRLKSEMRYLYIKLIINKVLLKNSKNYRERIRILKSHLIN